MEQPEVELIDFNIPHNAQLYMKKVVWTGSKEELASFLEDKMVPFGLVSFIHVEKSADETSDESSSCNEWYAYVNFYSTRCAARARLHLHENLVVNGNACRVYQRNRKHSFADRRLSLRKCEQLANHYLGFNGWCSQVLYHRLESDEIDEETGKTKRTYATAIKLTFPRDQVEVEGAGIATAEYLHQTDKYSAMSMAQKFSKSAAMQNAFAKAILVIVHNTGEKEKVTVVVDPTKKDPFYYNPLWDLPLCQLESEVDETA